MVTAPFVFIPQSWRLSYKEELRRSPGSGGGPSSSSSSSSSLCTPPLHPSFNLHLCLLLSPSLAFHSPSLPESPPRLLDSTSPLSSALSLHPRNSRRGSRRARPRCFPALPSNLVSAAGETPRISIIWKWMSKSGMGINVCASLKLLWAAAAKSIRQRRSGVRGAQRTTRAGMCLCDVSFQWIKATLFNGGSFGAHTNRTELCVVQP